jgi:hypothetical protein
MKGVRQPGCQRQPNFDSHISDVLADKAQQMVVFEKEQVLPVYRIVSLAWKCEGGLTHRLDACALGGSIDSSIAVFRVFRQREKHRSTPPPLESDDIHTRRLYRHSTCMSSLAACSGGLDGGGRGALFVVGGNKYGNSHFCFSFPKKPVFGK